MAEFFDLLRRVVSLGDFGRIENSLRLRLDEQRKKGENNGDFEMTGCVTWPDWDEYLRWFKRNV